MYSEVACLRHCWFDPLPVINFFFFYKTFPFYRIMCIGSVNYQLIMFRDVCIGMN